jgi:hypothetical protein
MTIRKLGTIAALVAAVSFSTPAISLAQGRGKGQAKAGKAHGQKHGAKGHAGKGHDPVDHDRRSGHVAIDRDAHARAVHEYAASGSLPPGLAKREELPPGLRKQLHERGELPPGLQKRLIAVPAPLVARLPPVPGHYRRYFAGDDLLVVDTRTKRIAAIVPNVWR